ncbi:MAG: PD40 domain-containing protein [Bacteroidales bacterium]|nr:PD40 domain-containing protein [Bacteroidales bacterium]
MKKKPANILVPVLFGALLCVGNIISAGARSHSSGFAAAPADTLDTIVPAVKELAASQLFAKGDSLRRAYSFEDALDAYEAAAKAASDSTERAKYEEGAMLAQNGLSMLGFCNKPVVVAREKFSLEDFFLYYPLPDRGWRPIPNVLDSVSTPLVRATWIPESETSVFYSAADADGIRNLYRTSFADSLWTAPELFGEQLTSSGNEIFPMVSPDGRNLYFASDGLYGMGGYDLYVSHWNPETRDWDTPMNMGFPYSSPYDDFLFINSPDGKYSIFASNRECGADSVYVYVLEYDSMPIRYSVDDDSDEIRSLVSLTPPADASKLDNREVVSKADDAESEQHRKYIARALDVRRLRDSIYVRGKLIDEAREKFASAAEEERKLLADNILAMEQSLISLEDSLSVAVKMLGKLEMDIIMSGQVINQDRLQEMADSDVKGADNGYAFTARRMGALPQMIVQQPVPEFDYSFMILPEGRFAEDNALPSGLVYQIQLFSSSRKATVADLKGLSPVFWRRSATLKNTYYAGLFRSYKDVLSNLNKVKKAGFKRAFIVAFNDGKLISVQEARKMEKTIVSTYRIRINVGPDGDLSDSARTVLLSIIGKDLARNEDADGVVTYVLGPFRDRAEAQSAATVLKVNGFADCNIEEVRK